MHIYQAAYSLLLNLHFVDAWGPYPLVLPGLRGQHLVSLLNTVEGAATVGPKLRQL